MLGDSINNVFVQLQHITFASIRTMLEWHSQSHSNITYHTHTHAKNYAFNIGEPVAALKYLRQMNLYI